MGHPQVENPTGFVLEPVFLADAEGRPLLVPTLKATFDLGPKGLVPAKRQEPVKPEGEPYGKPGESSDRFEPECIWPKPATDVVLIGSAVAPRPGATEVMVTLQIPPLRRTVRVLGDRVFFKSIGGVELTRPVAFEKIPLVWERAFGGWDRSLPEPAKHSCERRNPVGTGHRGPGTRFEEGIRAPNLEDPERPLKGWGDRPPPAGLGFIGPHWEPRAKYAGTYDEAWSKNRSPLLPTNFDRRFLNAAAPGLVAPGHLTGAETVQAAGVAATPLVFRLPGLPPPQFLVSHAGRADARVASALDTVVIDTDSRRVFLYWRGELPVREPTAVRTLAVLPAA